MRLWTVLAASVSITLAMPAAAAAQAPCQQEWEAYQNAEFGRQIFTKWLADLEAERERVELEMKSLTALQRYAAGSLWNGEIDKLNGRIAEIDDTLTKYGSAGDNWTRQRDRALGRYRACQRVAGILPPGPPPSVPTAPMPVSTGPQPVTTTLPQPVGVLGPRSAAPRVAGPKCFGYGSLAACRVGPQSPRPPRGGSAWPRPRAPSGNCHINPTTGQPHCIGRQSRGGMTTARAIGQRRTLPQRNLRARPQHRDAMRTAGGVRRGMSSMRRMPARPRAGIRAGGLGRAHGGLARQGGSARQSSFAMRGRFGGRSFGRGLR
jgi:hypothetical protein